MTDNSQNRPRVIRANSDQAAQWMPPDIHQGERQTSSSPVSPEPQSPPEQAESSSLPTAAQLEQITSQAYDEGYERGQKEGFEYGHSEGLEAAREEMLQRLNQFDQILAKLEAPFEDLDDQVEHEVVTLVVAMVRQLVRREVKTDPGQIAGVVREALGTLPVNARNVRVQLHPEDAVLVREAYSMAEHEQKWQLEEDPVMQRGGCRVYSDNSHIDATLESRLNALIAPLLAEERHPERADKSDSD